MILPGSEIRLHSVDEAVVYSGWFWSEGFTSTLQAKKQTYRLNNNLQAYYIEVMEMAKKNDIRRGSVSSSSANSVDWINTNLTVDDEIAIVNWLADTPDLLIEYCRAIDQGYSLGVKPARSGDGFMATLISPAPSDNSGSVGLSAYADTPYNALGCLLYKFVSLLDGTLSKSAVNTRSRFR